MLLAANYILLAFCTTLVSTSSYIKSGNTNKQPAVNPVNITPTTTTTTAHPCAELCRVNITMACIRCNMQYSRDTYNRREHPAHNVTWEAAVLKDDAVQHDSYIGGNTNQQPVVNPVNTTTTTTTTTTVHPCAELCRVNFTMACIRCNRQYFRNTYNNREQPAHNVTWEVAVMKNLVQHDDPMYMADPAHSSDQVASSTRKPQTVKPFCRACAASTTFNRALMALCLRVCRRSAPVPRFQKQVSQQKPNEIIKEATLDFQFKIGKGDRYKFNKNIVYRWQPFNKELTIFFVGSLSVIILLLLVVIGLLCRRSLFKKNIEKRNIKMRP